MCFPFGCSIPKAINPRLNTLPDFFILSTRYIWRTVDASSRNTLILSRRRVSEPDDAELVRLLLWHVIEFQSLWSLWGSVQPGFDDVLALVSDLARHAKVCDCKLGLVDASVVEHGDRVSFDGL